MIKKEIVVLGEKKVIACDAKCNKAFGINGRPFVKQKNDYDDVIWLSDDEVGNAPDAGQTAVATEYGEYKPNPIFSETKLNKWCYKECERCVEVNPRQSIDLPDFSERVPNKQKKFIKSRKHMIH